MVTSMIPSVDNVFVNKSIVDMRFLSAYIPLIKYDWSTTTTKKYKTDGVELFTEPELLAATNAVKTGYNFVLTGAARGSGVKTSTTITSGVLVEVEFEIYDYVYAAYNAIEVYIVGGIIVKIPNANGIYKAQLIQTTGIPREITIRNNHPELATYSIRYISTQKVIEEPNKRYLKDVGSTPTYNANMYFGRGAYLNGVDQTITVPINTTIQTVLKRVNGVVTINETLQVLTNYVISGLGVHKDYYLFTRLLTTAEKDSYTNTPELFYAMAQADNTCVLNMPMCETSSTARNYKTGIDYPITNYTSSVRDNAKNLQYGLQTCKFVRDGLGVIQSASDYLECNGIGYAIIPGHTDKVNIKMTVNPTSLSGNLLSGGVTKTLTGLTLNVDNNVVISNVTPTGAITLASGFSGTIKTYIEELV